MFELEVVNLLALSPEVVVEDLLITNAILMVKKLKAAGDYARAEIIEKTLKARRNAMLITLGNAIKETK